MTTCKAIRSDVLQRLKVSRLPSMIVYPANTQSQANTPGTLHQVQLMRDEVTWDRLHFPSQPNESMDIDNEDAGGLLLQGDDAGWDAAMSDDEEGRKRDAIRVILP